MKREKISEAIGNISSRHIKEAIEYRKTGKFRSKGKAWMWGSIAACFLLLFTATLVIPILNQDDFEIENGVLLSYNGDDTEVEIPLSVTKIADYAFRDNKNAKNIETIVITANVQSIGNYAFYGCEKLSTVSLSENQSYFQNNDGLILSKDGKTLIYVNESAGETVDIPTSVTYIQSCAISYSNIRDLTVPESITSIEEYGIIFNDSLESVVLNGVTKIGKNAFYNNVSLKKIIAPKAIVIDENAFSGCSSLRIALFPATQLIGANTFFNCNSLEEIALPSAIRIADGAFSNCSNLFSVKLDLVEEIGNNAFSESGLTMLHCPNVTLLGRNFLYYTKVTELEIPKVTSGLSPDVFNGSGVKTLIGNKGSYVEQYAIQNGYLFLNVAEVAYPDGYVETNDIVYVLSMGATLMKGENGEIVHVLSPFEETKVPLQRYAMGDNYSIVGYGGELYYVNNSVITETRPNIQEGSVSGYGDFEYVEYDTYVEITHYRGTNVDIVVPEKINGKPVLKLANTFLDGIASDTSMMRKVVRSITANSVTTLEAGMGFWRELYSLETLILPKVERIGDGQFQDATKLKYIDLSSVKYIGDYSFNSMQRCETIILSEIEAISKNAFVNTKILIVKAKQNEYAEEWAKSQNAVYELIFDATN